MEVVAAQMQRRERETETFPDHEGGHHATNPVDPSRGSVCFGIRGWTVAFRIIVVTSNNNYRISRGEPGGNDRCFCAKAFPMLYPGVSIADPIRQEWTLKSTAGHIRTDAKHISEEAA